MNQTENSLPFLGTLIIRINDKNTIKSMPKINQKLITFLLESKEKQNCN